MSNRKSARKAGEGFGPTLSTRSVLHALNVIGADAAAFSAAYDASPRGNRTGGARPLTPAQEKAVHTYNETRDFNALISFAGSVGSATKLIGRAVRLGL